MNYRKNICYPFNLPPVQTCTIISSSTPMFNVSSKVLHHHTSILHCELQVAAIDSSDVAKYMKFFMTSTRCLFHLSFRNTKFLQIAERVFFFLFMGTFVYNLKHPCVQLWHTRECHPALMLEEFVLSNSVLF